MKRKQPENTRNQEAVKLKIFFGTVSMSQNKPAQNKKEINEQIRVPEKR
jgi:hypothetical protein